jgi:multiple antibiotic resistance protein
MLAFALTALTSILFVVDPVGTVPAYLVMAEGDSPLKRRRTARRASLAVALTLCAFAAAGETTFHLLGLTMPAFEVAGGLILFLVALDMLRAQRATQEGPGEVAEGKAKDDQAITPLAIPMLAGPAALSTVATLITQARDTSERALVYAAIVVTGAVVYVTLRLAIPLYAVLGRTGIHVLSRLLGLVLAGLAVQFVLNGLRHAGVLPVPSQ